MKHGADGRAPCHLSFCKRSFMVLRWINLPIALYIKVYISICVSDKWYIKRLYKC